MRLQPGYPSAKFMVLESSRKAEYMPQTALLGSAHPLTKHRYNCTGFNQSLALLNQRFTARLPHLRWVECRTSCSTAARRIHSWHHRVWGWVWGLGEWEIAHVRDPGARRLAHASSQLRRDRRGIPSGPQSPSGVWASVGGWCQWPSVSCNSPRRSLRSRNTFPERMKSLVGGSPTTSPSRDDSRATSRHGRSATWWARRKPPRIWVQCNWT